MQCQRGVERPASSGCATRLEERCAEHDSSRNHQPEAEVVHAGESHVRRADLQWNHPVSKTHEGRHDGAEHHDEAVHGGELVEQLRVDQLQTRLKQLSADQQGQDATDDQHRESEQQVQSTDVFVVGSKYPTLPSVWGTVVVVVAMDVAVRIENCAHDVFLFNGGD